MPMPDRIDPLLSPKEASDLLNVSSRTLRRYVHNGLLKSAGRLPNGHNRFRQSDVEALLIADETAEAAS